MALHRSGTGRPQPRGPRRTGTRNQHWELRIGTAFVHTVVDDHSWVAYAEIHDDEKAVTAIDVLHRAVAWFAARGVTVERVLTDNGSAYKSYAWRDACTELGVTPKKTRPYRPQTNGPSALLPNCRPARKSTLPASLVSV